MLRSNLLDIPESSKSKKKKKESYKRHFLRSKVILGKYREFLWFLGKNWINRRFQEKVSYGHIFFIFSAMLPRV